MRGVPRCALADQSLSCRPLEAAPAASAPVASDLSRLEISRASSCADRDGVGVADRPGGPGATPTLDSWTLNDIARVPGVLLDVPDVPHYVCEVRDFGDGLVEQVAYRSDCLPRCLRGGSKERVRLREEMTPENHERSVARSRREVRHSILMLKPTNMLTLTYRENQTNLAQAWLDFGRWARKVSASFKKFDYVCVPERQQRGAWHFHVAVRGYYNYNILRYFWRGSIKSGLPLSDRGNVTGAPSPKGREAWQVKEMARYMIKYMTKSMNEVTAIGARRYSKSKGIPEPRRQKFYVLLSDAARLQMGRVLDVVSPYGVRRCFESPGPTPVIWMASY